MNGVAPPTKRRKTSNEEDANGVISPIQSDIWFDDGSVILQAESTQFRVHRTMLARHSSVFRDIFHGPQPHDESLIEGCPIIPLSDSAEDIRLALIALYDGGGYHSRRALRFPVVAAMLRIGKKYKLNHLHDEAITRLQSEFPSTLENWEVMSPEYTHIVLQKGILFDIVNLATECGVWSIFPAAYYLCVQDLDPLLSGEQRDDGTVARLPFSIQKACILGREKILIAQAEHTLGWLDDEEISDRCENPMACARACLEISRCIWKPMPDVSRGLEKWSDVKTDGLCRSCREDAKEIHQDGRQKMWEMLPSFFDLPDWEELKG